MFGGRRGLLHGVLCAMRESLVPARLVAEEEAAVLVQVALPAQALGAAEEAAEAAVVAAAVVVTAAVAVLEVLPSCSHRCRLCWLHRRLAPRGSRWQKPVG